MGGNLIQKHLGINNRISKPEYRKILSRICIIFDNFIEHNFSNEYIYPRARVPLSYRSKESFGDLDVIVPKIAGLNYKDAIKKLYNPRFININSNIYSFDVNDFQIDFIVLPPEETEFAFNYFSYNDLSHLMGKLYKSVGLSYGHSGLYFNVFNTHIDKNAEKPLLYKKILLTRDSEKAFRFLDFSFDRFNQGFNTLTEIFQYIVNNKHFRPEIFNFKDNSRENKRHTVREFISYINKPENLYYKELIDNQELKQHFYYKAMQFFPGFITDLQNLKEEIAKNNIIKSKFNGEMVKKYVKCPEDIGKYMALFKKEYISFNDYVLNNSKDQIEDDFVYFLINTTNKRV